MQRWFSCCLTAFFALGFLSCSPSPVAGVDAGASAPGLASPDLASTQPAPTIKIATGVYAVAGVTADDQVVLIDPVKSGAFAAPIGGGLMQTVDPGAVIIAVEGKLVFAWSHVDQNGLGDVTRWSAAGGSVQLGVGSATRLFAVSDDGAFIAWSDGGAATVGDLRIARADGSHAMKVFSQVVLDDSCRPRLAFAAKSHRLIASYCPKPGDGGAVSAVVSSVDGETGQVTDLKTPAEDFFSIDRTGGHVLVISDTHVGDVVTVTGDHHQLLTQQMSAGYLLAGATEVVYQSNANGNGSGALGRVLVNGGMATPLVAGGVDRIEAISPDEGWLVYSTRRGMGTSSDLFLIGTRSGRVTTLSENTRGGLRDDAFTADSSHVLYLTSVMASSAGTLRSQPVSGGPPVEHGTSVFNVRAALGTRVVFNDHYRPALQSRGRADLYLVDTAKSDAPVLLAAAADVVFFLSANRDRVVYAVQDTPGTEGIFVTGLPQ